MFASRCVCLVIILFIVIPARGGAQTRPPAPRVSDRSADALLSEARRLYNSGDYDGAERVARNALQHPASASAAHVVLGRVLLERFRRSANPEHLIEARASLRDADALRLDPRERVELTIGFGEAFFLEDRFAAAAEMLEPVLETSALLGGAAQERVLDWWATALDRHAQSRPATERAGHYSRIARRMTLELARDPRIGAASYWQVVAARGLGDLELAWASAMAAWVRAALAPDHGAAVRGDLDRLMMQGIIPERAARIAPRDPASTITGLTNEWEAFKAAWSR